MRCLLLDSYRQRNDRMWEGNANRSAFDGITIGHLWRHRQIFGCRCGLCWRWWQKGKFHIPFRLSVDLGESEYVNNKKWLLLGTVLIGWSDFDEYSWLFTAMLLAEFKLQFKSSRKHLLESQTLSSFRSAQLLCEEKTEQKNISNWCWCNHW